MPSLLEGGSASLEGLQMGRLTGPDRFVSSPVPNFETGPKYDFTVQSGLDCDTVRS